MTSKILLGYDGSDSANDALRFAVRLAKAFGAEMHVLAVARPPELGDDVETSAIIENSRRHYEQIVERAREQLASERLNAHFQVTVGHPAEQLVRYAEANRVDHIVVGHRGHTMFERWLIGSVARQVIAYANCAVTVVRRPPH
jgi:nucleotide-binding universal stress UspA family protein